MKKVILALLYLLLIFVTMYTIAWCVCSYKIANDLNKYVNGEYNKYSFKFKKITPTGFPFKIAFKVKNWTEDNKIGKTECLSDIYIGYNLLKQNFFLNYSGEVLAWYKPLASRFGSKIIINDYILSAKIPINIENIRKIINQNKNDDESRSLFQIVNFIEKLHISSGKMQVKDLINSELLYEQEHKLIELSFDKRKYYKNIEDFLNNVPNQITILQKAKVNKIVLNRLIMPPSMLFSVDLPIKFDGENKISIKLKQPKFEDMLRNCEIHYQAIKSNSSLHKGDADIFYTGKISPDHKDVDINLKISAYFLLKQRFFDSAFYSLKSLTDLSNSKDMTNILKERKVINMILGNYINNLNNSALRKLENRDYNLKIDFSFSKNDQDVSCQLNEANIFSNQTGVNFKSIADYQQSFLKGILSIHNYKFITSLLLIDDLFGVLKHFSTISRNIYFNTALEFLRFVSDHPTSNSDNISFEYFIDFNKLDQSKLGNVEIKNLIAIFNSILYRNALGEITSDRVDESDELLMKLLPTFTLHDIETLRSETKNRD